ncbi:S8 family serine peptidase [Helicobacter equorum]|uniref:S8 family serine peptidase n=1 Tax=Helicobacter equorum TaxID=361872 RepID=UPI000CF091FA|nr:S8 family serine peptidase [Helicobacter equorum]
MHGTHVAGIALGNYAPLSDGRAMHGIAPSSMLYGVTYINETYPFTYEASDIVNFLNGKVKVVNNSWGITFFPNSNKAIDNSKSNFDNKYTEFSKNKITPSLVFAVADEKEYEGLKPQVQTG